MNSQNMFVFAANPEGIVTTSVSTAAAPTNLEQVNSTLGPKSISPGLDAGAAKLKQDNPDFNQTIYKPIQ